jgi:hypothetical protein
MLIKAADNLPNFLHFDEWGLLVVVYGKTQ